MYKILKFFLFQLPAEQAHHITTFLFRFLCKTPILSLLTERAFRFENKKLEFSLWGLNFKNPVGLAAGFDKDGKYIASMAKLGFGFIEVGTVTPRPQIGNPKPRLFRLPKDQAIINRMGFNNEGVDYLVNRLKVLKKGDLIIGGNIGKNKGTPNEHAFEDYLICFQKLYPFVDYFVVNLSSPNTPGLRDLQEKGPLKKILASLLNYRLAQSVQRPILLKIAPDLSDGQLQDVLDIVEELKIEGIIATNTTIARSPLLTNQTIVSSIGAGGLSGSPLFKKSTEIVKHISSYTKGSLPIIGVGGIDSVDSAISKFDAGASLVQIYSGLIYSGPFLVKNIKKAILKNQE